MWGKRLNELNEADREQIWLRFDEGSANMTQLAKRFGVSVATISRELANRRRRSNVARRADEKASVAQSSEQLEKQLPEKTAEADASLLLAQGSERKSGRQAQENSRHRRSSVVSQ